MAWNGPEAGITASEDQFTRFRSPLFGLAPGGVYHATDVAAGAVRSYRTLSPLPRQSFENERRGGLLSVALSLGSPPPDVIRHRCSMEPGLSSAENEERGPFSDSGRPTDWFHKR